MIFVVDNTRHQDTLCLASRRFPFRWWDPSIRFAGKLPRVSLFEYCFRSSLKRMNGRVPSREVIQQQKNSLLLELGRIFQFVIDYLIDSMSHKCVTLISIRKIHNIHNYWNSFSLEKYFSLFLLYALIVHFCLSTNKTHSTIFITYSIVVLLISYTKYESISIKKAFLHLLIELKINIS